MGPTQLKVKYGNTEMSVQIKYVKDPFKLVGLTAHPKGKPDRLAKAGETLYLVDGDYDRLTTTFITNQDEEVVYTAAFDEDPDLRYYSSNELFWSYKDQTQYRHDQLETSKKEITRAIEEDNVTLTTSVTAGYPDKTTKAIDIKWIDGSVKNFAFVPPATGAVLTKTFEDADNNLKLVDKYINFGLKFKVEPIKITGRLFNQVDKTSRLYKEVNTVLLPRVQRSKPMKSCSRCLYSIFSSALRSLTLDYTAKLNLVFTWPEVWRRTNTLNRPKRKVHSLSQNFTARGCIEGGLKAKLLVATDLVDFEVKGYAQACLAALSGLILLLSVSLEKSPFHR